MSHPCYTKTGTPKFYFKYFFLETQGITIFPTLQVPKETKSDGGRIRTYDLRLRRPLLYPAELRHLVKNSLIDRGYQSVALQTI